MKYNFLFYRPGDSRPSLLFVSRQQHGRKGGCKTRMNRVRLHISTPPGSLTYMKHPTSAILHLVTIRIRCAIKPLFVIYLHATGREKHLLQIWSGLSFKPFPRANWPVTRVFFLFIFFFWGGGHSSTWHQVEDGYSVVLQKKTEISSREEKDSEGSV